MGKFVVRLRPKLDRKSLLKEYPGVNTGFAHALHSDSFLKDNDHLFSEPREVRSLAVYHNTKGRKGMEEIVWTADNLSSSERIKLSEEYEEEYKRAVGGKMPYGDIPTPLFSVFAQVELTRARRFVGDRYDLAPLNVHDESIFPIPEDKAQKLENAYHRLIERMEDDKLLEQRTWRLLPELNFKDDIVTIYYTRLGRLIQM